MSSGVLLLLITSRTLARMTVTDPRKKDESAGADRGRSGPVAWLPGLIAVLAAVLLIGTVHTGGWVVGRDEGYGITMSYAPSGFDGPDDVKAHGAPSGEGPESSDVTSEVALTLYRSIDPSAPAEITALTVLALVVLLLGLLRLAGAYLGAVWRVVGVAAMAGLAAVLMMYDAIVRQLTNAGHGTDASDLSASYSAGWPMMLTLVALVGMVVAGAWAAEIRPAPHRGENRRRLPNDGAQI
jgi:hypothetical protein